MVRFAQSSFRAKDKWLAKWDYNILRLCSPLPVGVLRAEIRVARSNRPKANKTITTA